MHTESICKIPYKTTELRTKYSHTNQNTQASEANQHNSSKKSKQAYQHKMSKLILAIVLLATVLHSLECLTQGAGALVGKRDANTLARAKKIFSPLVTQQLQRLVSSCLFFFCFFFLIKIIFL